MSTPTATAAAAIRPPSNRAVSPAGLAYLASGGKWWIAPHLALLNRRLMDVAGGRCPRLIVCMPPRHGKSSLISQYYPAWYLGSCPDRRVILASYEADFAASWGRKARNVLAEHGSKLFGISVAQDSKAVDRWQIHGRQGGMDTAGVGGALTGKGGNLCLLDDPIKNAEEANSQHQRDKVWDWFISTFYTRLEPNGSIVLVTTRWHADDLAGRLLKQSAAGGERWESIVLPALAESGDILGRQPGEALWPERFPVAELQRIRVAQDDPAAGKVKHWFDCLYQQRPVPASGDCFQRSWFRYWVAEGEARDLYRLHGDPSCLVPARDCRRFGVVDLAFSTRKEADYTVLSAWAVTPQSDLILLDLDRRQMQGPDILPALEAMHRRYDLSYWGIEANGAQLAVVQEARRRGLAVRALKADTDKVSRSIVAQERCEAGQVYFPERVPWLSDFEAELLSFPKGSHDDCIDVCSYAAIEVFRRGGAPEPEAVVMAKVEAEQKRQEADWMRMDNPAWWPGAEGAF